MRSRRKKHLSQRNVLGQKGVNLIERVVLKMGSRWIPGGPNEVGIDGYIELFDPGSGEALGKTIAVQSKAVSTLQNDSEEYFDYWCDRRDLEYWTQVNLPVVLVVSRPEHDEAYWVSVKDYLQDAQNRATTRIRFNKASNRLTPHSIVKLAELEQASITGLLLPPLPKSEHVYSNLLPLKSSPPYIYIAHTELRKASEIRTLLQSSGGSSYDAWVLKNKTILSFHNLQEHPWQQVCDPGTVDYFETLEWSESEDADRQRGFVELLNRTLRSDLWPDVRYWPREDCYALSGSLERGTQRLSYRSAKKNSKLAGVTRFERKLSDGRLFQWLRHMAFRGQFRHLSGKWYLEITPTYRFTRDGTTLDFYHEDRLRGIKRIEGNRAVLSSVLFWADYLRQTGLFGRRQLEFEELYSSQIDVGIDDSGWSLNDMPSEPNDEVEDLQELLFVDH